MYFSSLRNFSHTVEENKLVISDMNTPNKRKQLIAHTLGMQKIALLKTAKPGIMGLTKMVTLKACLK